VGISDTTKFTWCDSQTTGSTNGTSNQAAVSLGSQTTGGTFGVDIYEDTVYHLWFLNRPEDVSERLQWAMTGQSAG
jgi:hypothetical protein